MKKWKKWLLLVLSAAVLLSGLRIREEAVAAELESPALKVSEEAGAEEQPEKKDGESGGDGADEEKAEPGNEEQPEINGQNGGGQKPENGGRRTDKDGNHRMGLDRFGNSSESQYDTF